MANYPLLKVDGVFGSTTKEYFQRYMRVKGWYTRAVDASFGAQSWMGVQRMCKYHGYYNRAIDGQNGPYTQKATLFVISNKMDGDYNLGRHYSAGDWTIGFPHPDATKCLQRWLNANARYNLSVYPRQYPV